MKRINLVQSFVPKHPTPDEIARHAAEMERICFDEMYVGSSYPGKETDTYQPTETHPDSIFLRFNREGEEQEEEEDDDDGETVASDKPVSGRRNSHIQRYSWERRDDPIIPRFLFMEPKFRYFPDLPREIQQQIWDAVIPEFPCANYLELYHDDDWTDDEKCKIPLKLRGESRCYRRDRSSFITRDVISQVHKASYDYITSQRKLVRVTIPYPTWGLKHHQRREFDTRECHYEFEIPLQYRVHRAEGRRPKSYKMRTILVDPKRDILFLRPQWHERRFRRGEIQRVTRSGQIFLSNEVKALLAKFDRIGLQIIFRNHPTPIEEMMKLLMDGAGWDCIDSPTRDRHFYLDDTTKLGRPRHHTIDKHFCGLNVQLMYSSINKHGNKHGHISDTTGPTPIRWTLCWEANQAVEHVRKTYPTERLTTHLVQAMTEPHKMGDKNPIYHDCFTEAHMEKPNYPYRATAAESAVAIIAKNFITYPPPGSRKLLHLLEPVASNGIFWKAFVYAERDEDDPLQVRDHRLWMMRSFHHELQGDCGLDGLYPMFYEVLDDC